MVINEKCQKSIIKNNQKQSKKSNEQKINEGGGYQKKCMFITNTANTNTEITKKK